MLSNQRKRLRNEQRCAAMRERFERVAIRQREAALALEEKENLAFERMGVYLDESHRRYQAELRVSAQAGVRISQVALTARSVYVLGSVQPPKLWPSAVRDQFSDIRKAA